MAYKCEHGALSGKEAWRYAVEPRPASHHQRNPEILAARTPFLLGATLVAIHMVIARTWHA
eukprot:8007298-Pyramimonas_sp.AAC.1